MLHKCRKWFSNDSVEVPVNFIVTMSLAGSFNPVLKDPVLIV